MFGSHIFNCHRLYIGGCFSAPAMIDFFVHHSTQPTCPSWPLVWGEWYGEGDRSQQKHNANLLRSRRSGRSPATYISNLSGHFRGLEDQKPVRPRAFLTHFVRHSWHGYEHKKSRWTGFLVYTQSQASDTSLVSHLFGPCSLTHISLL